MIYAIQDEWSVLKDESASHQESWLHAGSTYIYATIFIGMKAQRITYGDYDQRPNSQAMAWVLICRETQDLIN